MSEIQPVARSNSNEDELNLARQGENNVNDNSVNNERQLPSLPDIDNSREAWFYVIASFIQEMLFFGPLFSTGIYLKYYAASPDFRSASEPQISLIGTLSLFFGYSAGIPLLYLYNHFPRSMRPSMWAGMILCSSSLLVASFVKDVKLLIIFQGVGPGLSGALCAFPIVRWIPEWFDKRKGIATGLIFSGGGVGGVYMPFLYDLFLDKLGYKWSLRIFAISTAVISGMTISFVKPRVPISSKSNVIRMPMPNFFQTFFTSWGFLFLFLATLLQSFGYFNVALFLPRFSDTLSSATGAGLLGAFNVSCLISQILWGHITDRISPSLAMSFSSGLGLILVLFLWGFNQDYLGIKVLMPFAISFGLITGGFSSMWSQSAHELLGDQSLDKEKMSLLWSGLSVARGIGSILGPTIGSLLYKPPSTMSTSGFHRWGSAGSPGLIALVAASLFGSCLISLFNYSLNKFIKPLLKEKSMRLNANSTNCDIAASNYDDTAAGANLRGTQKNPRIHSNIIEMNTRNW
ncbi:uncharacterized protein L201_007991 [Kwoniella dendrophila CBS 6074]|uniref:Major facilitator superfamily (MFS) profile domain-containing protein n=1 Tax=Kwoniella dendrophila CBS 6074 TaxID=1295534 RepID=A0AAX4K850_9TREE